MIDHEYLNSVIEEYNEELNSPKFLNKKERMPGNLYHAPVLIRYPNSNGFHELTPEMDAESVIPICGSIKDAQTKTLSLIGRTLIGYTATTRMSQTRTAKESLKFIVENAKMDVQEKLHQKFGNIIYNYDSSYIGECFLKFKKHPNGNYFMDMENSAAYDLKMYSSCGINPPYYIDTSTFDPTIAKRLWNIRWNNT